MTTNKNIILYDNRASSVLYRYLIALPAKYTFILPVNICPIVVHVFHAAGFPLKFVDIDSSTLFADVKQTLSLLSKIQYSGVLLNHTYGCEADFSGTINKIKANSNSLIIEDKCLCNPTFNSNEFVDLTLYSTGYAKMIELSYGGGYGIIKNKMASKQNAKEKISLPGDTTLSINSFPKKIDNYLKEIEEKRPVVIDHKNKINEIYTYYLRETALNNEYNTWRYNVIVKNKDLVLKKIFENKLFASSHYIPKLNQRKKFTNAFKLHDSIINLFNDHYFNEKQAETIAKLILKHN